MKTSEVKHRTLENTVHDVRNDSGTVTVVVTRKGQTVAASLKD